MPAYSCKLACGRWVVVTCHQEANQNFYIEKHLFSSMHWAREHAYRKNCGRWDGTVYAPGSKNLEPSQEL